MHLLCKSQQPGLNDEVPATPELKLQYLKKTILTVVNLLVEALITFYSLENDIKNDKDLRRELLINLATNIVLDDDVYTLVHNMTVIKLEKSVEAIRVKPEV